MATTNGSGSDQLERAELDAQVRGGLKWVSLAVAGLELTGMGTTVVMARLVDPANYGRAVIALIVPVIASILTYEGFGTPLVQRAEISERHIETANFISLVSGAILTALVILFGLTLAKPIFGAQMDALFELASPAFLIVGASAVPRALLSRSLSWRLMNGADVGGSLITGLVSITLAICGLQARSIVLGALAGALTTTLLLWTGARPSRPRFHRRETKDIVVFGANTSLAGVAGTIRRNIDYIMLATRVSPHLVGIYWRGFSTGVDYQSKISGVTGRVLMMVLPRATNDEDLRAVRRRLIRLNTIVVFPFLGMLITTAPWAIPAIYGARWSGAVVPSQVLAVAGMAFAVMAGIDGVAVASGHPGLLAVLNCIAVVAVGSVAYLLAPFGIDVVAAAMAGLELLGMLVAQYFVLTRCVGIPMRETLRDPLTALICTAIMIAVTAPIAILLGHVLPALVNVGVCGVIGLVVYGAVAGRLSPEGRLVLRALLQALAPVRRIASRWLRRRPLRAAAARLP